MREVRAGHGTKIAAQMLVLESEILSFMGGENKKNLAYELLVFACEGINCKSGHHARVIVGTRDMPFFKFIFSLRLEGIEGFRKSFEAISLLLEIYEDPIFNRKIEDIKEGEGAH